MEQQDLPTLEDVKPTDTPVPAPKEPEVSKELFDKFKADNAAYQSKLKDTEKQLEDMKMAKLKESKNWQEIARIKEEEATQAKQSNEQLKNSIVSYHKMMALRTEAQKSGINPVGLDDLDLFDFSEVSVETTNQGKIIVHGADAAILRLKTLRPHWFLKNPSAVNPSSPEVKSPSGELDFNSLVTLQKEYQKNPGNVVAKKAYEEAIRKYKAK